MDTIKQMTRDADIMACYPVMAQLRPHIEAAEFLPRILAQMEDGYRLAALVRDDRVSAVAGFRLGHNLAWGRFLYVDDLVTDSEQRSSGLGRALLEWLGNQAREHGCGQLHLDSGLQRTDAHRFYQRQGMSISSHHFVLAV